MDATARANMAEKFARYHAERSALRAQQPAPTADDVAEYEAWLDRISAPVPMTPAGWGAIEADEAPFVAEPLPSDDIIDVDTFDVVLSAYRLRSRKGA